MEDQPKLDAPEDDIFKYAPDYFLGKVVQLANDGISQGITLTVGGAIITGMTISGKRYFEGVADQNRKIVTDEKSTIVINAISDLYEEYKDIYRDDAEIGAGIVPIRPAFIHLENARYLLSGPKLIPGYGMFWRGRLSSVSGFSLGMLNID